MKKKIAIVILSFATVVATTTTIYGATTAKKIEAELDDIKIYLEDQILNLKDASGNPVEPILYNGSVYIPVRAVSESMGYQVDWDGDLNSVTIKEEKSEEQPSPSPEPEPSPSPEPEPSPSPEPEPEPTPNLELYNKQYEQLTAQYNSEMDKLDEEAQQAYIEREKSILNLQQTGRATEMSISLVNGTYRGKMADIEDRRKALTSKYESDVDQLKQSFGIA